MLLGVDVAGHQPTILGSIRPESGQAQSGYFFVQRALIRQETFAGSILLSSRRPACDGLGR